MDAKTYYSYCIPRFARSREDSAVDADVDGQGGRVIQQVDLASRALLHDELLPSDAPGLLYQDLERTRARAGYVSYVYTYIIIQPHPYANKIYRVVIVVMVMMLLITMLIRAHVL